MANDDVPIEEMHECYTVHQYDRDSVEEVEDCIEEGEYETLDHVDEHLEFLADIENKISYQINQEAKHNHSTLDLVDFLSHVKEVHKRLIKTRNILDERIPPERFKQAEKEEPSARRYPVRFFKR